MSKRHVFPSLRYASKHAYTFQEDSMALWDQAYRANGALWVRAGFYDTCGDGLVQHGFERCVSKELFEDYCASLASYLQNELPVEDRENIASLWFWGPSVREIQFLTSVKYQEGKRTFYSLTEQKVSKSDAKQHDKRWEEVPRWADGSAQSAVRLLLRERIPETMEIYATYDHIRQYLSDHTGSYEMGPAEYLGITGTDVSQAYSALDRSFQAIRLAETARRVLECHKRNVLRSVETDAEDRAAA